MATIETTPWFMTVTAGVETLTHFTSVVQKVNHELSKLALNDPNFGGIEERRESDCFRVQRGVLLVDESYGISPDEGS